MIVGQIVSSEQPLPSGLEYIDHVNYVYLTCLCDWMLIQGAEIYYATEGIR